VRWRTPAALIFLFVVTAAFYWKLTFSSAYTWLESPDMAFQVRPWLDLAAREFHAGRFPVWDPYLWGGQSLIGQVQPGVANPLNWILFALPLRDGHIPLATLHWYWVLIHWLAAVFAYAFCRELGAGLAGSLLGACIFGLTGYMGHTDWPQMLMSAIWAPLVLLFMARLLSGKQPWSSAALGGAALGMAFLAGHHNIPIYTALVTAVLWCWLVGLWRSRDVWFQATIFGMVCLLVSALQVLPAIEYGRQAVRWVGAAAPLRWQDKVPYAIHAHYSLPLRSIPGLVVPRMWEGLSVNPYVGVVAVALALAGVVRRWRSLQVRFAAVVAFMGLVLALGTHTPLYRALYTVVPLIEKARSPAMAIVLAHLGVAALASLGLDAWQIKARRIQWVAAFTVFLVEAVVAAPHLGRLDRPGGYVSAMDAQANIAAFLKRQPGWFRISVDEAAVPYNFGDWWGIEEFGGYVVSLPQKVSHVVGSEEAPRLFGIQYHIGRRPARPGQMPVFESRNGLRVYRDSAIAQPLWSTCGLADGLRVVLREPDRFVVDADILCSGLMVTGDPRFSGWGAWVDGSPTAIQEYANVVRAVAVPAGRHRVEFRYRPVSVYWGGGLTALGFLIAAWAIVSTRPRVQRSNSVSAIGSATGNWQV
jgi:hypothetical protein